MLKKNSSFNVVKLLKDCLKQINQWDKIETFKGIILKFLLALNKAI